MRWITAYFCITWLGCFFYFDHISNMFKSWYTGLIPLILGPKQFIIFINDIVNDLNVKFILYGDNMKLFCEIWSLNDCLNLQQNLERLNFCYQTNKLPIIPKKCATMSYFCRKLSILFKYPIVALGRPEFIRDWDVYCDLKLSFTIYF